jgi:glutamate synthase (NADPH/NADH) small chain
VTRLDENREPIRGSEFTIETDLVVLALGQQRTADLVTDLPGVETERGRVVVDAMGATGRRGVYAGGDCVNGGKEVVNAVAEGNTAAIAIDAFLRGVSHA